MKRIFSFLFAITISLFAIEANAQCKAKQIVKSCRGDLNPYFYDGYALSDITFTGKEQKIEVEFTAFGRQKYRMAFCHSGFEETVPLKIYDKSSRSRSRNVIFQRESVQKAVWNITPSKTTTYYIEYSIPASSATKKGCVIMLIGYSDVHYGDDFD